MEYEHSDWRGRYGTGFVLGRRLVCGVRWPNQITDTQNEYGPHARQPPVRGEDPQWRKLQVTCGERQDTLSYTWRRQRMVSEKTTALAEATMTLARGGSPGTVIRRYRTHVPCQVQQATPVEFPLRRAF